MKSIMEEFRSSQTSNDARLSQGKGDKILKPYVEKGKVKDTKISAKENLAFKEVIGLTQTGRQGLGVNEKK